MARAIIVENFGSPAHVLLTCGRKQLLRGVEELLDAIQIMGSGKKIEVEVKISSIY